MSSARSNTSRARRGLARTRRAGTPGKTQARHLRLWEAIRGTRQELSERQERVDRIDTLFRQSILPRETRLVSLHAQLTESLMDHHESSPLDSADHALLTLWINDNLQTLADHPFACTSQREALLQRWRAMQTSAEAQNAHGTHDGPMRSDASGKPNRSTLDELFDDDLDEEDEIFDFGWHRSASRSSGAGTNGRGESHSPDEPSSDSADKPGPGASAESSTDETRQGAHDENAAAADEQSIDRLEQSLSVERLFRQLARILHPDREQDESRKVEKHVLMSECLRARQHKDIDALLTLYCEHVGDLPDGSSEGDHEALVRALEQQLSRLQRQLRQLCFGNPLQAQIFDRYSDDDVAVTQQRIEQHADLLDEEILRQQDSLNRLRDHRGLQAELAIRREHELDRLAINSLTGYSPGR